MSDHQSDNEFIFYFKTELPSEGWIQCCFICNAETAQTIVVDNNVYKLSCKHNSVVLKPENCKMFACYQCKIKIKNNIISAQKIYKHCENFFKY